MQTIRVTQERIETEDTAFRFNGTKKAGAYLQKKIGNLASEILVVLALNIKNEVIGYYEVFKGTLDMTVVSPREIIQFALLSNAKKIAISHNHPNGTITPSKADCEFTDKLNKCCEILELELVDHILVTESEYLSFREEDML